MIFLLNIKCIIKNTLDRCIFKIKLYDTKDKFTFHGKTNIYGNLSISDLRCGIYTVEITSIYGIKPKFYKTKIYYNGNLYVKLYFDLYKEKTKLPIILKLYDKYYNDLKIREGKIILWQNHIQ